MKTNRLWGLPDKEGLYDPFFEHDNCGVGFLVNIKGKKSHTIIEDGLKILRNLEHRGAVGSDSDTGDGAGIMIQIPHYFFAKECKKLGIDVISEGNYGVGMLFLPKDSAKRKKCKKLLEKIIIDEGQSVLGWRKVPVDNSGIGELAKKSQPYIEQVFIERNTYNEEEFERKLFIIRKRVESRIIKTGWRFQIPSCSCRKIVYKGLLLANQIMEFYKDLKDKDMVSAFCIVHQRYSTNTFPSWELAQPFRFLAHNGEINTLKGNINWMNARENLLSSSILKDDIRKIHPVVTPGGSDSSSLDNVLELLYFCGRSLPHSMMLLIPEAWDNNEHIDEKRKSFYEYNSTLIEPWDGPAAVAFTDGKQICATLDRNGLRPARYIVTKDDYVVLASESGVLDFAPEQIEYKGKLKPGKMLIIDIEQGRIIDDSEIKDTIINSQPYHKWIQENKISLSELEDPHIVLLPDSKKLLIDQKVFGYTIEDQRMIIEPMVLKGSEPIGSMGADTPLSVLSKRSTLLFSYFKQLFAQVTNPAIDPIREKLVMSLTSYIGSESNLFEESPQQCKLLKINNPILSIADIEKIRNIKTEGLRPKTLPILYKLDQGEAGLKAALQNLCESVSISIKEAYNLVILSDKGFSEDLVPIPSLLATSTLHNYLIREGLRTKTAIILETGEPREVMHFALLIGYGASAICPYLVFKIIADMVLQGIFPFDIDNQRAERKYIKAIQKGLLKIFSKMGISTLQSYKGSQIFESVGLNKEFVNKYFTGTPSRIGGIGLSEITEESLIRHREAYPDRKTPYTTLNVEGKFRYRKTGEYHLFNPDTIVKLQIAARNNDKKAYKEFSSLINKQNENISTLRGLFRFKKGKPVPIDKVEPVSEIIKRFYTGAMSFGSISKEAHETIAIAMNRLGAASNSGEGGENPERFIKMPNGDSKNSAVKQVASGRFGVTSNYLVNARELQIKVAQGAKPGEGGQLPGHKVNDIIAKVRYSTPGVTLISPPPHHDIYSIEDLAQLIFDLKNVNPSARVSVKLVSEAGVGTVAAGVAKANADMVLISGYDGGTGASPLSSIWNAGVPWEIGLSETQQVLVKNKLRDRIKVQTDGKITTGRDVVIAAMLGAEEFGFSTAVLVVLGCIMMRKCHLNTCPAGVATQNPDLRKRFKGRPEYLENYFRFVAQEVREIMADLGYTSFNEMIGQSDRLKVKKAVHQWKAKGLDFSQVLFKLSNTRGRTFRSIRKQPSILKNVLDKKLIRLAGKSLKNKRKCIIEHVIKNTNRAVGAMLSGKISKLYGEKGLPDNTIRCFFKGTAGQSFGAFLAGGVTFNLEGDANDYVGKGLSGGRIIIYPPAKATFKPEENIIAGNTILYGATRGYAFINGIVGERFAIRNSGVSAVVEGVGDHGCEYMTGGTVVVLGETGRNFAAGMSGGIAYVFDEHNTFENNCNKEMVELIRFLDDADKNILHNLIKQHHTCTRSVKAKIILDNWEDKLTNFIKIFPKEYKRALARIKHGK